MGVCREKGGFLGERGGGGVWYSCYYARQSIYQVKISCVLVMAGVLKFYRLSF